MAIDVAIPTLMAELCYIENSIFEVIVAQLIYMNDINVNLFFNIIYPMGLSYCLWIKAIRKGTLAVTKM